MCADAGSQKSIFFLDDEGMCDINCMSAIAGVDRAIVYDAIEKRG